MAQFRAGSGSYQQVRQVTIDPTSIAAFSTSVETFTPTGFGDVDNDSQIRVDAPSIETGVRIIASRMTAKGTIELTLENFTNAPVDPASQTMNVLVF